MLYTQFKNIWNVISNKCRKQTFKLVWGKVNLNDSVYIYTWTYYNLELMQCKGYKNILQIINKSIEGNRYTCTCTSSYPFHSETRAIRLLCSRLGRLRLLTWTLKLAKSILYKLLFSRGFYFRDFREPDPRENFHFNSCLFIVMTTSEKSRN